MDLTPGRATPEGTRRFSERNRSKFSDRHAYRTAPTSQYSVSGLGFGCYRIDHGIPEHRSSLEQALKAGINLIDTSTNYADGGSESCVGEVLEGLFNRGELKRDEVVVVSKVGYVQGSNLDLAQARESGGRPYQEMVKYMDGCWHCLHPEFLQEQLARSRERLKLGTIDVYLLHNPEYYLADALKKRQVKKLDAALIDEFYRRIYEAFLFLEREAQAGRIVYYGVSSNTLAGERGRSDTTSLRRFHEAAQRAAKTVGAGPSRFAFIQLPMNLFEMSPATEKIEGAENSVLESAVLLKLGVLLNRPLNAITNGKLVRLTDFHIPGTESVANCLQRLKNLEVQFDAQLKPTLPQAKGVSPGDILKWGESLERVNIETLEVDYIRQVSEQIIFPRTDYAIAQIEATLDPTQLIPWRTWKGEYQSALQAAIRSLYSVCAKRAQAASDGIRNGLKPLLPKGLEEARLSQLTLAILMGFSGVSSVLNGMRRQEYVDDSLGAMKMPALNLKPQSVRDAMLASVPS